MCVINSIPLGFFLARFGYLPVAWVATLQGMHGQKDLHAPHQLSCSLLQCSLDPSLLLAQELWFPAKSQGKAEVPQKLWIQAGWLSWHLIHLCFCPCILPFYNTHLEFISPVFCCCILSFPCSCIIQLSFSGSVFAPSFLPLSSLCSVCRRKTASHAIQPWEPWVTTVWKEKEGRQP